MGRIQTPFRFDHVGSYLRPRQLKAARERYAEGQISAAVLEETEDECIRRLVEKEKAAGLHAITDGEFRRATWHLDYMWGFDGVGHKKTETGLPFHDEAAMIDDTYLTGRIAYRKGSHPFLQHYAFLKQFEDADTVAKLTIPAPAQFLEQMIMPFAWANSHRFYETKDEVARDIVAVYQAFIQDAYEAGVRNLQLDDCSWGMLVDPHATAIFRVTKEGLDDLKEQFLRVNNEAIAAAPADLVVNTHVCRGNFHSTYASSGSYESVAQTLLARENVNAYYLEFDDARSGDFSPLAAVTGEKKVVLGLVTTKSPLLEDKAAVIARIQDAARYLPLDRLALSPQCGFASCEIGNKLTEEEQWAKLKLVREIADEVWGEG